MTTKLPEIDSVMAGLWYVWQTVGPDAVGYSPSEKAELVLDHADGYTGDQVDALVAEYGYDVVLKQVSVTLFGGK